MIPQAVQKKIDDAYEFAQESGVRTLNNPALNAARDGVTILNTPWLMYIHADWEMDADRSGPTPIPLEGGPRLLKQGWYTAEIVEGEPELVCRVRRVEDETVQRVVLE